MSLRRDIHSAFESIAPPLGGMPERVVQTVLADDRRRRKVKVVFRLRLSLALVAAVLLVAVVAAAIITWNSLHTSNVSPAGLAPQTQLAQLEARPLTLPTPASHCTAGPFNASGDLGSGPVYGQGGGTSTTDWGIYFHNLAYAETDIKGPILIRARDLFTHEPVIFVGRYATGPVIGNDTVDGAAVTQHTYLVVDKGSASNSPSTHKFAWPFIAGVRGNWSGWTGWQIDGAGFSETFVAC